MVGGVVQCPWHGSQFDCRKGAVRAGPAREPIGIYPISVRDGKVLLTLGQ
jgi:nitrite reductase/ring-hydroxylating ferredoxin subunit